MRRMYMLHLRCILTIQAPDEASFEKFVEENRQVIVDFFTRAEMNRQIAVLENNHNDYVSTKVKSMFDCDVWVPGELTATEDREKTSFGQVRMLLQVIKILLSIPILIPTRIHLRKSILCISATL